MMINRFAARFAENRRAAVAVIMAISLVPLMLLVGIAVDITFLYQSRTQTAFASQAAATQAVRIAAATYQVEVANGSSSTLAAQHAIAAANTVGNLWFNATAGTLIRTSLTAPSTNTTFDGATTGAVNTSAPPNFSATVTVTGTYPPIFDPIFKSTTNWVYASNATATTTYSYAQILLMLDTSGSMLIGADDTTQNPDIQTLEENTVCPAQGDIIPSEAGQYANTVAGGHALSDGEYESDVGAPQDKDAVDFTKIPNYSPGSGDALYVDGTVNNGNTFNGTCQSNFGLKSPAYYYPNKSEPSTTAGDPCALACHFSSNKFTYSANGKSYFADYYGLARLENDLSKANGGPGVHLRIDVLFSATEQVIQDMETSEAVANQLSVGVYQFNTDVSAIASGAAADSLPEATSDLSTALSEVEADDYQITPTETAIPQLINGATSLNTTANTAGEGGDTNFPLSLNDLQNGNPVALKAGKKQPLTVSGNGAAAATPEKFMFIVTDGLEDDSPNNGGGENGANVMGEMTSISGETAGTGSCSYLKNTLKYTVYVLYVTYYPIAAKAYYAPAVEGSRPTNEATNGDYPADINASDQVITETPTQTTSPTAKALQACATSPTDFYQASSSADIQTALAAMLKSALASTIRLTN